MTMKLYKPILAGALLVALPAVSGLAQTYPQQGYQGQYQDQAQQLDNLVAPIALYPDALLSQILVAATYSQQLAEASAWLGQMGNLSGQQLMEAAQQQNWDPSVQALVAFPDVLRRLTQDPRWTADLGNAFLNDEAGVMNAVQEMRARAMDAGRLNSTPQQTVTVDSDRAIEIAPTNPEVVYVPTYDPYYVWGAPAYGYYPSLYYPSFGFGFGGGIVVGAFFGGYRGGFGHWGWGPGWHDHRVYVNNDFFNRNHFNGYSNGRYAGGSNSFSAGRDMNRQPVQPGFSQNLNRSQNYSQSYGQGFRPQPQYSRPESVPQAHGFQPAPRQEFTAPQTFRAAPRQEMPRQEFVQPRSFQPAPRPSYSQPPVQRFESRGGGERRR
jgi:hypothetical protein